jgi:hypothetical protein
VLLFFSFLFYFSFLTLERSCSDSDSNNNSRASAPHASRYAQPATYNESIGVNGLLVPSDTDTSDGMPLACTGGVLVLSFLLALIVQKYKHFRWHATTVAAAAAAATAGRLQPVAACQLQLQLLAGTAANNSCSCCSCSTACLPTTVAAVAAAAAAATAGRHAVGLHGWGFTTQFTSCTSTKVQILTQKSCRGTTIHTACAKTPYCTQVA